MAGHRIFTMPFAVVYTALVKKAERKGRKKEEVDCVICWLTGYDQEGLHNQIAQKKLSKPSLLKRRPCIRTGR